MLPVFSFSLWDGHHCIECLGFTTTAISNCDWPSGAIGRPRDLYFSRIRGNPQCTYGKDSATCLKVKEAMESQLTELEYKVTRENATERPFTGLSWYHREQGVCGGVVAGVV